MNATETALLKSLFAKDESGKVFLRVVKSTPQGKLSNAVNSQSGANLSSLLAKAIVLDSDGKPALCLTEVEYGMRREEKIEANKKAAAEAEAERQAKQQESYKAKTTETSEATPAENGTGVDLTVNV